MVEWILKRDQFTSISRRPGSKTKRYVQDELWDQRDWIGELICQKKGYVYICGDAKNMAKEVEETLKRILAHYRSGSVEVEGLKELKVLKDRNRLLLVRRGFSIYLFFFSFLF